MTRFVDISRFRAPVIVLGVIVTMLAALDVSVHAALTLTPPTLVRAEYLSPDLTNELGGRISGIAREPGTKPLAVIVGLSSAREGLLADVLEARDPHARRWVNLGGSGGSFYELSYYLRPLFWSDLHPDLIVLAVHPVWMAGRTSNDLDEESDFDAGSLKMRVKRASWLVFNRNRLNIRMRRALTTAREEMFLALGFPLDTLFAPPADPWAVHRIYSGHADKLFLAKQLHRWEGWRWFDPARYREDETESVAAGEVIRACQGAAKKVVVVFMPETAELRGRVPAEAELALRRVIASVPNPPPVLDLRATVPDDDFYDRSHMSDPGRPIISKVLADRLATLDPP